MKYQALRRKSDKQWMRFDYSTITEVSVPVKTSLEFIPQYLPGSYINWSLYEIVTVYVVPEDEMPTKQEIQSHFKAASDKALDIIEWYKSKIFKS